MSKLNKEKELQSIENKLYSLQKQKNFFIRNFWKVLGFGIFISAYGPKYLFDKRADKYGNELTVEGFTFDEWVGITAIMYVGVCVLAHFIWKYQDDKTERILTERKEKLVRELANY